MKDILFVSNGHGEDEIACRILDAIRQEAADPLTIEGWPMVGEGAAYRAREVVIVGTPNTLPSGGFGTLSLRLWLRDLRAGWIGTYLCQMRSARAMKSQYRIAIAVGDIVPVAASVLSRARYLFIGSAKSSHYRGFYRYTRFEKWFLRKSCDMAFPRDILTLEEMNRARVPCRYVGNAMMDGLDGTGDNFGIPHDKLVVAMLPGSRSDSEQNLLDLMTAAAAVADIATTPAAYRFIFPVRQALDPGAVRRMIEADNRTRGWRISDENQKTCKGVVLRAVSAGGAEVLLVKSQFADVLRLATIAVGMAGTGNEQAVGVGLPLIAVPSSGVQGKAYVAMKAQYFGEAAITVRLDPEEIANAVITLMLDPERRARMARAGRSRMGGPGASRAIAHEVLARLSRA